MTSSYSPTVWDVIEAKNVLVNANLPLEIIDIIIDAAEYWPRTRNVVSFKERPQWAGMVTGSSMLEDKLLLRCCPLTFTTPPSSPSHAVDWCFDWLPAHQLRPLKREYCTSDFHQYVAGGNDYPSPSSGLRFLDHPCKKIVFTIESHDQGWGGNHSQNRFLESHTWVEVGLERFDRDVCEGDCKDCYKEIVYSTLFWPPPYPLSSGEMSQPVDGREEKAKAKAEDDGKDDASDDALLAKMRSDLSFYHLRPVIPSLKPFIRTSASLRTTEPEETKETCRYDFPLHPDERLKIQCNKRAQRATATYCIEWRASDNIAPDSAAAEDLLVSRGRGRGTGDGNFVRSLKPGDVITVWGKARYSGWVNHIENLQVDIYWAV